MRFGFRTPDIGEDSHKIYAAFEVVFNDIIALERANRLTISQKNVAETPTNINPKRCAR